MNIKLKDKEEIIKNSIICDTNTVGVYFLIDGDEIVFIGNTTQGLKQAYYHKKIKVFDRIYFQSCEHYKLDALLSEYLIKFNPKYNNTIYLNYISIPKIKALLSASGIQVDKRIIKQTILNLNIDVYTYNCQVYISKKDFSIIKEYILGVENDK